MPTVNQGASALVQISLGEICTVVPGAECFVDLVSGMPDAGFSSARLSNKVQTFGPYQEAALIRVRATSGSSDYNVAVASSFSNVLVVSPTAPADADGRPDGTIYIQTA